MNLEDDLLDEMDIEEIDMDEDEIADEIMDNLENILEEEGVNLEEIEMDEDEIADELDNLL
jgi:hypothetical protein